MNKKKMIPAAAAIEAKLDPYPKGEEVFDEIISLDGARYRDVDWIRPLLDYQEKTYVKENGKIIRAKYSYDPQEYGTYNSSGTLYYDGQERHFYKNYHVTSGSRYTFYQYELPSPTLRRKGFLLRRFAA